MTLVEHIKDLQELKHRLVLLLSHVYPLDTEMIKILLNTADSKSVFDDAKDFVFVKLLPNNYITLHDVMRDMINTYVWPEVHSDRRSWYSQKAIEIYEKNINRLSLELESQAQNLKSSEKEKSFECALKHAELEQNLWVLKEELLRHSLEIDIDKGIETFIAIFDEASKQAKLFRRNRFIDLLEKQSERLTKNQHCILDYYRARQSFDEGNFKETQEKCTGLLGYADLSPTVKVDALILKGNAEIRLGHVKESIQEFSEALRYANTNELKEKEILANTALGWAYRTMGDYNKAKHYYHQAKSLCMKQGGPENSSIYEIYGFILNNYAFVLSNDNKSRKAAIDMANTAIEHWKKIENSIGLGAGYLVRGIAYYRSDLSELAMDSFQKSLTIFEPLGINDWIGQIYSWRGAQYHDIQKFDLAKQDLEESLRIGAKNIEAMTLNRLARIYMNKQNWIEAERLLKSSLDRAKELPDYIYWIGSLARLINVSVKQHINDRKKIAEEYKKFTSGIEEFQKNLEYPDENSMGIAYLGLAKLLFLLNDYNKLSEIIKYLKLGIPLVVEHGSFARTDILTRLAIIEDDFDKVDSEIIKKVGSEMIKFISDKESENLNYSTAVDIIFRWANWN
ncbi:MAG: tetratricopeptide repeat protein [Candidatus Atribacteria bacterium]|nr:tetratricopeptide repeat protein [Candidatus Atribacteria bacterium]